MARRLLRRVKRFLGLSMEDRWLLGRAYVALTALDFALRTRGFQGVLDGAARRETPSERPVTPEDQHRAARYARWIHVASRFHLISAHCLHRSLTLHGWLVAEGLPSELRIGVRKEDNQLKAHAWVELDGEVVYESPSVISIFTPLTGLNGRATAPRRSESRLPWRPGAITGTERLSWR